MKPITSIKNLGGIDADNDELLDRCFQDHESYRQLINFDKFIILGRKGTGKTAIFRKILKEKSSDTFAYGHTFSDYPWHYHDKQVKLGVPDFDKYTHSWKYLIHLTLSKILLNQDQSVPYDERTLEHLSKIESFVLDTYGTRDPDITQVFTPSKKIRLKPTFEIDLKLFKAGIEAERVPMEELPTIIQEVNKNLSRYVLESLNPDHKYYIIFDQLDLGFEAKSEEYHNRLIGLLIAARDINNTAKQLGKKLGVCVFLRDDIYNNLKFEDKNKITVGHSSYIEWDTRGRHTLKQLIERRLTELLANSENESISWEFVFDETQVMTGKQTKYNYVIDRTFLRPRDIIQFCNEIIEQHKADTIRDAKITNSQIYAAKDEYSKYFINELDDEIHKHIPNYEEILEVFKSIGYYQFTLDHFIEKFQSRHSSTDKREGIASLKKLFDFSIIGYLIVGGSGGGAEYVFKYKNSKNQFDENASLFRIHLGLLENLKLKRTTAPSSGIIAADEADGNDE
jgi:hypothetical protein